MPTPEEQAAAMIANLPAKTGKSLTEWKAILGAAGLEKHGEMVKHLKSEYGIGHGFANLIAHEFRNAGPAPTGASDLVAAQYQRKEALRAIYDRLIAEVRSFGQDIEVAPKKSYVSLRRSKQFALIQPSTKTRLDVGLNLKNVNFTDRLELSGSFNSMVSHRVRLTKDSDVDAELIAWLRTAYDQA
ncbi:MAG: DUF4287 domain-containing protein [Gemmatimonadota bacterium]